MNKVFLIGNVGKDVEFKTFSNGGSVAQFTLATTERGKKLENGEKTPDKTEWHSIKATNKLAEIANNFVKKGDKLFVEGKIITRAYEDKGEKKYITEIIATEFEMLTPKKNEQ